MLIGQVDIAARLAYNEDLLREALGRRKALGRCKAVRPLRCVEAEKGGRG